MWPKKTNKYGAVRQKIAGVSSASKLESSVLLYLSLMEKTGVIKILKIQDHVYLTDAKILYIADFKIETVETHEVSWVEAKGFETPVWRIKKRLWKHYGPGPLDIYQGSYKAPKLVETVVPEGYDPKLK